MILKEFDKGLAHIVVYENRVQMGEAAGKEIAEKIRELQETKEEVNIMFAAAPSQNETLARLIQEKGICWEKINAFHMDEYIGIPTGHATSFVTFLKKAVFDRVPLKQVYCLDCTAKDPDAEARRYEGVLKRFPLDLCILGIGENGHIAFNDPGVADFEDSRNVKVVAIDERCKQQQVNDGNFAHISQVPPEAITVTIPGLTAAEYMYCVVPAATKAEAVKNLVTGEVSLSCPASILTRKKNAKIYLDADSAKDIL